MSWGIELWDQWENIGVHTQKGIDFCERYIHFLKERNAIELDYANKLKKLVKNFSPKKREEDDNIFTWYSAFVLMLKEVYDMAGQHEVVAENLQLTVSKNLHDLVHDLKTERKKCLNEGARLQEQLKQSQLQLDKVRRKYEKGWQDSEKAQDSYKKADSDVNLSRADVDKYRAIMNTKMQQGDDSKNEYAAQLQQYNHHQNLFYSQSMPQVFQSLQDMDERRTSKLQECVFQCAEIERNIVPILNTCIEGIAVAAGGIDAKQDIKLVTYRYKSGFPIPGNLIFEELSAGQPQETQPNSAPQATTPSNIVKAATLSGKSKKRIGIFSLFGSSKADEQKEDFSDLPPTQRQKKLQQKIIGIKKEISKEHSEREGALKLKDVYANNTALGDPNSLEKKIEENSQMLDRLHQELLKYEGYLTDAEGTTSSHSLSTSGIADTPHLLSPHNQQNVYQSIDGDDVYGEDEFDNFSVIGKCRALYTFDAVNNGSVPFGENEEMEVLEQDQGDGWTRVRKADGTEGFVPTSYIKCHYFDGSQV